MLLILELAVTIIERHAIVQEVSRFFLTASARVRTRDMSRWIYGGPNGIWLGLFRVLKFPLAIVTPPTAPHS
jgi:hypothetical protein